MKMRKIGSIGVAVIMVAAIGIYFKFNPIVDAAELTNVSPNPGDMFSLGQGINNPSQDPGGVAHMLKWETVAQVRETALGVYYNTPDTSSRNITIGRGSGNGDSQCLISSIKNDQGGSNADGAATNTTGSFARGDTYVFVKIEGVPGSVKQWNVPIKDVCSDLFQSYALDGITLDDSERALTGKYKATVTVSYSPRFDVGADGDWRHLGGSLTNSFNFTVSAGSNAIIGALKTDNSKTYGLRSAFFRGDPPRGVFFKQQFGFRCDEADLVNRRVKLYDPDINVFGDTYIKVTRNGNPLAVGEYNRALDENVDFNSGNFYSVNGSGGWIRATASTGTSSVVISNVIRGHTYKLWVINPLTNDHVNGPANTPPFPPNGNVLSVSIPNDSIYGDIDCSYKLRPQIDPLSDPTYIYYPNLRVDARIIEEDSGPIPEAHPWQIFAVRFPSEPSTRNLRDDYNNENPCGVNVMPAGATGCIKIADASYTAQPTYTIPSYTSGGPDSVGTRLCFFARIQNPTDDAGDDGLWSYSNMECSVSAKKPRVQFLGSDVRIGSDTAANGTAISSYFSLQGTNYGSWAEYGVMTKGANSLLSSGNSLRNGNSAPPGSWNGLTFANTPSYGNYNPVPTSTSAYTYFRSLPLSGTLNQTNPTTGVYDMGNANIGGTMTVNSNGQSIIIRKTGTLRINNDIIVNNTGVTGANNLSQVVIIADNIEFGVPASRIDAWLITSPTGSINTCAIGATQLTSNDCSSTLNINGPIYTNRLMLRRTAGNNPPNQFNEPAERFNLRPDAQLWAYNYANKADYAQTDFVQELPPRY